MRNQVTVLENLLFLVHRIPFPPNKGDKIRSYHLLRWLAKSYRVFLGAFIDDGSDWRHVDDAQVMCAETCFLPLHSTRGKIRSLKGFMSGQALTLPYYFDTRMQQWVNNVVESQGIEMVLIFSSAMAQYVEHLPIATKLIDFVDVDSDKWLQYSKGKRWPSNWIYKRESQRLFEFERRIANQFDWSIFVSGDEADLFRKMVPEASKRITSVENGVNADYFSPYQDFENPYTDGESVLVFTGAMDYWANADAVIWFANEVFPKIYKDNQQARFYIVGGKPLDTVQRLNHLNGVVVTGAVKDVRPYVKHAHLSVAPMRIARGIQNKVLEAMAMAKIVVATTAAMEGIRALPQMDLMVADDPLVMVENALNGLIRKPEQVFSQRNRQIVIDHYSWDQKFEEFASVLNS